MSVGLPVPNAVPSVQPLSSFWLRTVISPTISREWSKVQTGVSIPIRRAFKVHFNFEEAFKCHQFFKLRNQSQELTVRGAMNC